MKIQWIDYSTEDGLVSVLVRGQCNHAEAYVEEQSKNYTENLLVCRSCGESWVEENERMDERLYEN